MKVWADASFGLLGRSPDFLNTVLMAWAENADFFGQRGAQFADNVRRYYKHCRERDLFATHDTSTQRTITLPGFDRLQADFDASAIGGRVEGGWRNQFAGIGLTPYAAVQVQSLHAPAYSERSLVGGAFGLNTASQTVTDTRTELGVWADGRHVLSNEALAVLRGRAAWVHDFDPESRINAVFQTLPGSSFTVDGATAPRDSALLSAVGEVRLRNGFSFIAKADGEFANRATTYAGTGTVRYSW